MEMQVQEFFEEIKKKKNKNFVIYRFCKYLQLIK